MLMGRKESNQTNITSSDVTATISQWLSGRVLDLRPRGRGFKPHRRLCVVSLSKNINSSLVLVQPRKTCPCLTERLLMGRKDSNKQQQYCAQWVSESTEFFSHLRSYEGTIPKKYIIAAHAPWESHSYLPLVLQTGKIV